MNVAIGSDERTLLTDALIVALEKRTLHVTALGSLSGGAQMWPAVGHAVGLEVAEGRADCGIVCCWTGTGVTIAANKVAGVRAALCADAETARGARRWNDANVLALSLRAMSVPIALEILEAWFTTAPSGDPNDLRAIAAVER